MKQQHGRTLILTILVGVLVLGGACLSTGCNKHDSSGAAPVVATSDPNGEGVRPDVRAYIEATYPTSAKTRAALFQDAKVFEKAIADANEKQLSIQHADESNRADACLWYTFGTVKAYGEAQDALQPIILNTDERMKAYLKYDEQLGGQVFGDVPNDALACDINPSTLPN